ncbi:hypothetical protein ACIBP4_12155 [Micromonospora maritima]|uniref:Uncharacterized protein n=1 Tax=Micromonospora maritima TaxID=986711 RepID=A0ABW7ZJL1_9ACTN
MTDRTARTRLLAARQQAAARAIASEAAFHQARVLLLIAAFSGRTRGLRSLARMSRLDYLLRFPPVLQYISLPDAANWPSAATPLPAERRATDLAFAASRYGLWTDRYTLILGALLGRQLVTVVPGHLLEVITTSAGRAAATQLSDTSQWNRTRLRAEFLHRTLNISAARLDELLRPAIRRLEADTTQAHA